MKFQHSKSAVPSVPCEGRASSLRGKASRPTNAWLGLKALLSQTETQPPDRPLSPSPFSAFLSERHSNRACRQRDQVSLKRRSRESHGRRTCSHQESGSRRSQHWQRKLSRRPFSAFVLSRRVSFANCKDYQRKEPRSERQGHRVENHGVKKATPGSSSNGLCDLKEDEHSPQTEKKTKTKQPSLAT